MAEDWNLCPHYKEKFEGWGLLTDGEIVEDKMLNNPSCGQ